MHRMILKFSNLSWLQIFIKVCLLIISITYFYIGVNRLFSGIPYLPQSIDNAMRFYAGGFTAIGLSAIWIVLTNREHNIIIFFFAFFVFMTGVGRLVSIINVGFPNNTHLFYLAIELSLPLLMLVAQVRLNKK
ncbi:MAG: hypothetical protein CBD21_04925 [bacterium TMED161]|nr:MAG: hypothetical protein CBD21_04925 [bacterium TMED161]